MSIRKSTNAGSNLTALTLLLGSGLLFFACNDTSDHGHAHAGEGHDHESETSIDTTIHTGEIELFVEYPAFVAGKSSVFAAHFTKLDGHKPVSEGSVTVSLIKNNKGIRHKVNKPSSPGIFTPELLPAEAGNYRLIFELNAPGLQEKIDAGMVEVYTDNEAAVNALSNINKPEPEITYSKEQAWKTDFQTELVQRDTVYNLLKLAGKWMPAPGTQRTLNAGTSGNVLYEVPGMFEGIRVKRGQVLMRISGEDLNTSSLESEIKKAKAEYEQSRAEYERKKELHQLKVIPDAEFEEVVKRFKVAEANYQQMLKNYGENGVAIRSPIDGYIKHIAVENGGFANAGMPLLTVGSERSAMLKASATPEHGDQLTKTAKVWVMEPGNDQPVMGKIVSIGRSVSEDNPMLPVFIEVPGSVAAIEGSMAEVQLGFTDGKTGVVIPKSALLEDFGTYKVVVQTGGEAFEIRPVITGASNGGQVEILRGLQPGEWIVTEGAYQVKMAGMSGAPSHGHAH